MSSAVVPLLKRRRLALLHVRDRTGCTSHIYFEWAEGNPFTNFLCFFLFGQGEVAPVTREALREAEPDRSRRPRVHVGWGRARIIRRGVSRSARRLDQTVREGRDAGRRSSHCPSVRRGRCVTTRP